MTEPLSARVYASALRMYQSDNRMARPQPEDFAHLDVAQQPAPTGTSSPSAPATHAVRATDHQVRTALARMQSASGVRFGDLGGDAV